MLEANPHRVEELPVLRRYWSQWFQEMGVAKFRMERSQDSAKVTQGIIADFLRQPAASPVTTARIP